MSCRVLLSPEAEEQLRLADAWWRGNRLLVPELLLDEFAETVRLLGELPELGATFARSKIPGVRRLLMRRSAHWVYYVPDRGRSVVYVLAVWATRRGSDPQLGQGPAARP